MRLDPKFALAWALLSYVDALRFIDQFNLQPTIALREETRQAAETALALQPNLGGGAACQRILPLRLLKGLRNRSALLRASTSVPAQQQSNSGVAHGLCRTEARPVGSERGVPQRSRALDPRNVDLLTQRAYSYIDLRRFPEALRKLDQVLNITPDDVDTLALKAGIAQAEGDLPRAAALLTPLRPAADHTSALETQAYQAILERRPAQMIARLKEILATPDPALGYINGELRFWLGWAQEVAGDRCRPGKLAAGT